MKLVLEVCLIAAGLKGMVTGQDATKPMLRPGLPVQLAVAREAVPMPAADQFDAMVITVTADGNLLLGTQPVKVGALASITASTVYVKADARAPYQQVLTVLDALHGHSMVLLTAATAKPELGRILPPYGMKLAVGGKGWQ